MIIRAINEADKPLIEKSIAADSDHAGKSQLEFWLPKERTKCMAIEDDDGVLFYIRAESVLRLHMQTVPATDKSTRARIAKGIDAFAAYIKGEAKSNFRQIIFESTYVPLIRFLHKRGYRASKDEHLVDI